MNNSNIPLVSIICTTYNHEAYIRQCLDGFINQITTFKIEVLIHDDASTDKTADIIREYEQKYPDIIKPIYQTENQYSKGIKIGFTYLYPKAQGKYIAECEGDDYWTDSKKLQTQVDFMEKHNNYTMCCHNAMIHYCSSNEKDRIFADIKTGEYGRKEFFKKWITPTSSFLYLKKILYTELFQKVMSAPHIICQDFGLVITASYYGKIYIFENIMSVYRIHKNGITQSFRNIPYELCLQSVEEKSIFGSDLTPIFNEYIGMGASEALSLIFKERRPNDGLKLWILAFKNSPLKALKWSIKYFIRPIFYFCKTTMINLFYKK